MCPPLFFVEYKLSRRITLDHNLMKEREYLQQRGTIRNVYRSVLPLKHAYRSSRHV